MPLIVPSLALALLVGMSCCQATELMEWPLQYAVLSDSDDYTLECDTKERNIRWLAPSWTCSAPVGKALYISDIQLPCAGQYLCLSARKGLLLWSMYLLIADASLLDVTCFVESHTSSTLHCSADIDEEEGILRARASVSSTDMPQWYTATIDGTLSFTLSMDKFCAFEEQMEPILVEVQVATEKRFMSLNKLYYIRDIVKPSPPENMNVLKHNRQLLISWNYPTPWSNYASYFPMLFELNMIYRNDTEEQIKVEGAQVLAVSANVRTIKGRCRDLYYRSEWSPWTQGIETPLCK
ncbi:interleukin-12 subunit beta [Xenopus tropicalis]|nr:interleukin-12 subunit beta [Xenopus tropicalis]